VVPSETRFLYAVCGAVSGQARLLAEAKPGRTTHAEASKRWRNTDAAFRPADESALAVGTFAPFFCLDCAASYRGRHWAWRHFNAGESSGVEGSCPHEHSLVLFC